MKKLLWYNMYVLHFHRPCISKPVLHFTQKKPFYCLHEFDVLNCIVLWGTFHFELSGTLKPRLEVHLYLWLTVRLSAFWSRLLTLNHWITNEEWLTFNPSSILKTYLRYGLVWLLHFTMENWLFPLPLVFDLLCRYSLFKKILFGKCSAKQTLTLS